MTEPLVDAEAIAEYTKFSKTKVIRLAKAGDIPAVPFPSGRKTYFRFRLSEVEAHLQSTTAKK